MIYVTGDTHGGSDTKKIVSRHITNTLTKDDTLIICGDFGFIWDPKKEARKEQTWLDWFAGMPWTTVFADGNHECFPRLYSYPEEEWNGGKVHVIRKNLFHLIRGNIYTIENNRIYVMGGAASHDKFHTRSQLGKAWWEEELPNDEEYARSESNLNALERHVDCIITHCLPTSLQEVMNLDGYKQNHLTDYFDTILSNTTFTHWYCGHYHEDADLDHNVTVLFNKVIPMFRTVANSNPIPGSPIYKKGCHVRFTRDNVDYDGIIETIYPWGMLNQKDQPLYSIRTDEDNKLINMVKETAIFQRIR